MCQRFLNSILQLIVFSCLAKKVYMGLISQSNTRPETWIHYYFACMWPNGLGSPTQACFPKIMKTDRIHVLIYNYKIMIYFYRFADNRTKDVNKWESFVCICRQHHINLHGSVIFLVCMCCYAGSPGSTGSSRGDSLLATTSLICTPPRQSFLSCTNSLCKF